MNINLKNPFVYAEIDDASEVRYLSDEKLAGFWTQLEVSPVSTHTEELWYNKTVNLWMTICIFIYKCGTLLEK